MTKSRMKGKKSEAATKTTVSQNNTFEDFDEFGEQFASHEDDCLRRYKPQKAKPNIATLNKESTKRYGASFSKIAVPLAPNPRAIKTAGPAQQLTANAAP